MPPILYFLAHQPRLSAAGRKGGYCGSRAAALQAALSGALATGREGGSGGGHAGVLSGLQCPRGGEAGEQQQVCHGVFGVALLRWRWWGCGGGGAGERCLGSGGTTTTRKHCWGGGRGAAGRLLCWRSSSGALVAGRDDGCSRCAVAVALLGWWWHCRVLGWWRAWVGERGGIAGAGGQWCQA